MPIFIDVHPLLITLYFSPKYNNHERRQKEWNMYNVKKCNNFLKLFLFFYDFFTFMLNLFLRILLEKENEKTKLGLILIEIQSQWLILVKKNECSKKNLLKKDFYHR